MKPLIENRWIRISLLCLMVVVVTSCNADEDGNGFPEQTPVEFEDGKRKVTNATDNDNWVADGRIGLFMIKNRQPLQAPNILEGADNVEYRALTGGSAITGFAPVGNTIYYPHEGDKVDFIAYYPYNSSMTNFLYPVDVTNQTSPANIDILYANTASTHPDGYDKKSGSVELEFNHALSKVSFTLLPGEGSPDLTGVKVAVRGIYRTAELNLTDRQLSSIGSMGDLIANSAADGLSSSVIMIPQALSTGKLVVTLADNVSNFEWDFPGSTLIRSGRDHRYNIIVSRTGINVTTSGITDWTGGSDPATIVPAERVKYQVGDYYPYPDNPATAIGVVFQITDGIGYHGKFVDLDWVQRYVNVDGVQYDIKWGDPTVDEDAEGVVGIRSYDEGYEGTKNLILKRKDQANFAATYCLFNWIYQTKNKGDTQGIWYLPAYNELRVVIQLRENVLNPKIVAAGGRELPGGYYKVSTERSMSESGIMDAWGNINKDIKSSATWNHIAVAIGSF